MKKIITFATIILAVTTVSCKKTYTCLCTKSGTDTFSTTVSSKSTSAAKSDCSKYDSNVLGTCSVK